MTKRTLAPPRPVLTAEAAELSELACRSKASWGYSDEFMEACREELTYSAAEIRAGELEFWAVDDVQGIAGFYALGAPVNQRCELEALFVRPDRLGSGLGRLLVEHAMRRLGARGASTMIIQGDPHAERFYTRAGGIKTGERASGSIDGRMLPVFEITPGEGTLNKEAPED